MLGVGKIFKCFWMKSLRNLSTCAFIWLQNIVKNSNTVKYICDVIFLFYLLIYLKCNFFSDGKAEFSASLLQFSL